MGQVESAGADYINIKFECSAFKKSMMERSLQGPQQVDLGPSAVNFKRMSKALETFTTLEYYKNRFVC